MESKQINIVWCDDNIDHLYDNLMDDKFKNHHCYLLDRAKSSEELRRILEDKMVFIDAIIVDFNLGKDTTTPDKESAEGFRWIHDNLDNKEYKHKPFYLLSARDKEFIDKKYEQYDIPKEDDYFHRDRIFNPEHIDDLLDKIEEEVEAIRTPEFKIRQEFHEAFDSIEEFKFDSDYGSSEILMKIMLLNEDVDRYDLTSIANQLRMIIERMVAKMANDCIIPKEFNNNLNGVPELLSGKDKVNCFYYSREDFMPKPLYNAFNLFLSYTQDGSHDKNYLTIDFKNYITSSRDVYIVKALAIMCLDIIKWSYSFYNKYIDIKPCKDTPFESFVIDIVQVPYKKGGEDIMQEGAVVEKDGKKYFVPQYPDGNPQKYKKGTRVRVKSAKPTRLEGFDYYGWGENLGEC